MSGDNGKLIGHDDAEPQKTQRQEFDAFLEDRLKDHQGLATELREYLKDWIPITEIVVAVQEKEPGKYLPLVNPTSRIMVLDYAKNEVGRSVEAIIMQHRVKQYQKEHPLVKVPPKGGIMRFARGKR